MQVSIRVSPITFLRHHRTQNISYIALIEVFVLCRSVIGSKGSQDGVRN